MGGGYQLRTSGEYPMDEVASAMQKCIRRGLEEEALYWALELETHFFQYVWKRLAVTAAEDIGMANPMASVLVESLWQTYMICRKDSATKSVDENVIAFAVLYLCRSPKNREVDDFKNVVVEERKDQQRLNGEPQNQVRREIPDFALDLHTDRGRRMKRGLQHWWEEGIQLDQQVGGSKYRRRAGKLLTGIDQPDDTDEPGGGERARRSSRRPPVSTTREPGQGTSLGNERLP